MRKDQSHVGAFRTTLASRLGSRLYNQVTLQSKWCSLQKSIVSCIIWPGSSFCLVNCDVSVMRCSKCYFKRLGGFADPAMDISVLIGMDKLWRIQECDDFMSYIFISHIERQLVLRSVLVGIWHHKIPIENNIKLRLVFFYGSKFCFLL